MDLLTEKELELVEDAGKLMCRFHDLQQVHPDDENDFKHAVHIMQDLILRRAAQRAFPGRIATYTPETHPELYADIKVCLKK